MKQILCIKLVKYWNKYAEMHGQQNVKICGELPALSLHLFYGVYSWILYNPWNKKNHFSKQNWAVIPYIGDATNSFLDCKDKMIKYCTIHADLVPLNISLKILPQLPPKFLSYFRSNSVSAQFLSSTLCTKPPRLLHAFDLFLKHYLVFNLPLPEGQAGTALEPPEP